MLFSIICLTYKRPELLEECVYSVLQQSIQDWELLIINDCVDQTIQFSHPQIRIFNLNEKFKSIADKRNFGLDNASGEFILQLDDDDFLLPSYLEHLKNAIGKADVLCYQRPIMYWDDPKKICLSPVPQSNSFIYRKQTLQNVVRYENSPTDEGITLNSFYKRVWRSIDNRKMIQLTPDQCGHVWRQDINPLRKYSLVDFLKRKTTESEQQSILSTVEYQPGNVVLSPKWNKDYVTIIKENLTIIPPNYAYGQISGGIDILNIAISASMESRKTSTVETNKSTISAWPKVKPTWSDALKFIQSVKSRGVVATTLDVVGVDNTGGERVSDSIYDIRMKSCFGDTTSKKCSQLKHDPEIGHFCGACGCGKNKLAILIDDGESYTKLHYPYLECPLKKPGFSNYEVPMSIIMPVLNDNEEANLTIKSIYDTSPNDVDVIVIDDGSDVPVKIDDPRVRVFRFDKRIGAGQSRHFGAQNAKSKHLLFIDSHMRFDPKWFDNAFNRMSNSPKTLWCGTCLGLNSQNMDINKPVGVYTGADLVLYSEKNQTIFDGVWRPDILDKDDYEISCVMGACYFIHKDWYFHIKGLEQTMMWGSEEPILSTKTWLAGGEVRLMKSVRLGHKFRDTSPYSTNVSHIHYNKLAYMYMLFPTDMYKRILSKFPNDGNTKAALDLVAKNKVLLDSEKEYYKSIFKYDINWLCEKFNIKTSF